MTRRAVIRMFAFLALSTRILQTFDTNLIHWFSPTWVCSLTTGVNMDPAWMGSGGV